MAVAVALATGVAKAGLADTVGTAVGLATGVAKAGLGTGVGSALRVATAEQDGEAALTTSRAFDGRCAGRWP